MLMISNKLNCFINEQVSLMLIIQHLLEIIPGKGDKNNGTGWQRAMDPCVGSQEGSAACRWKNGWNNRWIVWTKNVVPQRRTFEVSRASLLGGIGFVPIEVNEGICVNDRCNGRDQWAIDQQETTRVVMEVGSARVHSTGSMRTSEESVRACRIAEQNDKRRTSIGSMRVDKRNRRLDRWRWLELGSSPCEEEDEDLVCKQATTTKESVAGTTTNERRTVDWIDDAGLSLELAVEEEELSTGSTWQRTKKNVDRIDELTNAPCVGKACRVGLQAATTTESSPCVGMGPCVGSVGVCRHVKRKSRVNYK